jgi:hypothetical protein
MKLEREYVFATISAFLVLYAALVDPAISMLLAIVLFVVYVVIRAARLREEET